MIAKWTLFVNRLKFLASCRDSMSAQTHFIGNLALDKCMQEQERQIDYEEVDIERNSI